MNILIVSDDLGALPSSCMEHLNRLKAVRLELVNHPSLASCGQITVEPQQFPVDFVNGQQYYKFRCVLTAADRQSLNNASLVQVVHIALSPVVTNSADGQWNSVINNKNNSISQGLQTIGRRINDSLLLIAPVLAIKLSTKSAPLADDGYPKHQRMFSVSVARKGRIAVPQLLTVCEEFGESLGTRLWDCSLLMTHYLFMESSIVKNRRVLELGAGTGLTAIAAGQLGAKYVLATDVGEQTMRVLRGNIANAAVGSVECNEFDWNGTVEDFETALLLKGNKSFDLVLASDVLYNSASHDALLDVLDWISMTVNPKVDILIAYKFRSDDEHLFFSKATARKYSFEKIYYIPDMSGSGVEAMIYRFKQAR